VVNVMREANEVARSFPAKRHESRRVRRFHSVLSSCVADFDTCVCSYSGSSPASRRERRVTGDGAAAEADIILVIQHLCYLDHGVDIWMGYEETNGVPTHASHQSHIAHDFYCGCIYHIFLYSHCML
jgi:hypothetical protein